MSFFTLPHHALEEENDVVNPLLDFAVPLYDRDDWLGTLVVTFSGQQLDYIVNNTSRLYKGKLLIAENNPDDINRHGFVIYGDNEKLNISQPRSSFVTLPEKFSNVLFDESVQSAEGLCKQKGNLIYYS